VIVSTGFFMKQETHKPVMVIDVGRVMDRYGNGRPPFFYTDDSPRFVEAARSLGWDAEVFLDAAHFKKEVVRRHSKVLHS
jgi:hypothetical protein